MKKEIKNPNNANYIYIYIYIYMVHIRREQYERNGVETIADSNGILSLNERLIEEQLAHKTLKNRNTAEKYLSDHRKHRYELVNE